MVLDTGSHLDQGSKPDFYLWKGHQVLRISSLPAR